MCLYDRNIVKRVNLMSSHCKGKQVFFPFFFSFYYIYMKKIDFNWTYCGNHFTIYLNQTTILSTLNLYGDVYQLFLNEIGKKNVSLTNSTQLSTCDGLNNGWKMSMFTSSKPVNILPYKAKKILQKWLRMLRWIIWIIQVYLI